MKNEKAVNAEARLDELLSQMPIEPSEGFAARVCAAVAEEASDRVLAAKPVLPSATFVSRVMTAIGEKTSEANAIAFPQRRPGALVRFARILAVLAAAACAVFAAVLTLSPGTPEPSLSEQVENVIAADPELARLAGADEEISFDDFVAASQFLKALNDNSTETEDFFAYYEN